MCQAGCLTTGLSSKRGTARSFFHLDCQLLEPGYTRTQKRVNTLNDAVQVIVLLRRWGSKLYMQRANQAARILWPKLRVRVRREPLDRNQLWTIPTCVSKWKE